MLVGRLFMKQAGTTNSIKTKANQLLFMIWKPANFIMVFQFSQFPFRSDISDSSYCFNAIKVFCFPLSTLVMSGKTGLTKVNW